MKAIIAALFLVMITTTLIGQAHATESFVFDCSRVTVTLNGEAVWKDSAESTWVLNDSGTLFSVDISLVYNEISSFHNADSVEFTFENEETNSRAILTSYKDTSDTSIYLRESGEGLYFTKCEMR